jgi:hypothetical protein
VTAWTISDDRQMRDEVQADIQTAVAADRERKRRGSRDLRAAAVAAFLESTLADGAVAVADLEVRARAAGLLGARQSITDSKKFKAAKKMLGIESRRIGFGAGGAWCWSLPTSVATEMSVEIGGPITGETVIDHAAAKQASVIYGEDHRRPTGGLGLQPVGVATSAPAPVAVQHQRSVPPDWIRGVARLDPFSAPAGVALHRWGVFVGDCTTFMHATKNWAERAAELGWDAYALFGCDRDRPLDQPGAGLLWRLGGGRITALHKDWAMVEIDGAQRAYHRRPAGMRSVLPWELGDP